MRFLLHGKMLLYILSHIVTGTVSGTCLLKATVCSWWNCLTISLISLKMTLSSEFPLGWTNYCPWRLLANSPWKSWQSSTVHWRRKIRKLVLYILQDDYLISSEANVPNTLIGQAECAKWGKSTQLVTSRYLWKYGTSASNHFKNQAFTWQLLVVVSNQSDLITKSSKMSNLLLSFQKCTGRVRTESCPRDSLCQLVQ